MYFYMLQKLFIQNEYSRVYISEQISYIIKQTQSSSGTMSNNIVVMYQHLDMLLSYWRDVELSYMARSEFASYQSKLI